MSKKQKEKLIIYQALVRLFGNSNDSKIPNGTIEQNGCGKMSDFSETALRSIRQLGCNCVWYTGLLQQATATDYTKYGFPRYNENVLKGKAGSPYAISDYYSVSCDLADDPAKRMEEFDALVERTHSVGLKMIIDFVPNHVAREYKSVTKPEGVVDLGEKDDPSQFSIRNNFYYLNEPLHIEGYEENPAKVSGNDVFHAWPSKNDWYETVKLNYGVDYATGENNFFPVPNTWKKMLHILMYWASKGVDGFRCDMVFMVPVDFWHWAIPQVKKKYKDIIFIAEIYDPALYRSYIHHGGFDYLYDKVGLYDTLRAVVECRESASAITHCWQHLNDIQENMLNFLENHDEQRIASDFFAGDPRKAYPALAVSLLMNTSPFMIYFGQELGERGMEEEGFSGRDGRTTIFDYWSIDSVREFKGPKGLWRRALLPKDQRVVREYYTKLLELAKEPVIAQGKFYDLTYCNFDNPGYDVHRTFSFFRSYGRFTWLIIANFDPEDKEVTLNIPEDAWKFVGIGSRKRHIQDLVSGAWDFVEHDITVPFKHKVPGYGCVVLRLS